jgi:negative regulator of flagellin synthesis FlgM
MQIYGPSNVSGAQGVSGPHNQRTPEPQQAASTSLGGDKLEISDAGQIASALANIPDIRQDRVDSIRQAIADGTYETEDKLSGAVDQLLDEIG